MTISKTIDLTKDQIYKLSLMCFTLFPESFNREGLLSERCESDAYKNLKNYYLINGHGKIHYTTATYSEFFKRFDYHIHNDINWLDFLLTTFQNKLYTVYDTFICGTGADYFNDLITENGINSKLVDKMFEQFNKIDNKTFEFYNLKKWDDNI